MSEVIIVTFISMLVVIFMLVGGVALGISAAVVMSVTSLAFGIFMLGIFVMVAGALFGWFS